MSRFLEALRSGRVLLMDGAMGTELQRAGLRDGECGEAWNLTHPERVRAIHQAYVEAGAECLLTNTFQANPQALARHGFGSQLEAILREGVALARAAAGSERFVIGDVGPVGGPTLVGDFQQILRGLEGVDALLLETASDLVDLAAVSRLGEGDGALPVLFSLTGQRTTEGGLADKAGAPLDLLVQHAEAYGPVGLGVNCGREVDVEDLARWANRPNRIPLLFRPNAGTPTRFGDRWVYPRTPADMAAHLPLLLRGPVCMIGGCCGTTPEHIAAFRAVLGP